jgi:MerR family copper efflux transcriptional regulator
MDRVKVLVGLWQDRARSSREVKQIALKQVTELEAKISELAAMKNALAELAKACHGDERPDCPILKDLEGQSETPAHSDKKLNANKTRIRSRSAHHPLE